MGNRRTKLRQVGIEDELWNAFGDIAGRDRGDVMRDFVRWYVHLPGADLPARPATPVRWVPDTTPGPAE